MFQISDKTRKILTIIFSVIGLLDSLVIYLVIEQESNAPGCNITGTVFHCGDVVNSAYGHVFGIPLSLIGVFYFVVILALFIVDYYDDYLMASITIIGLLSVIYFVFLELIVLNAFCLYCTVVHIAVIIIFLLYGPSSIKNSYEKLQKNFNKI